MAGVKAMTLALVAVMYFSPWESSTYMNQKLVMALKNMALRILTIETEKRVKGIIRASISTQKISLTK